MLAIARALLNDNRVLLVDEPTKGLAPALVAEVAHVLERLAELTTVLLVEQNLGVVRRIAHGAIVLDQGRVVHTSDAQRAARAARAREAAPQRGVARMSTFLLLTITGLGLGAMYFLIASGLSLIYGLMGVLNFAHGAFISVGSYGTWWFSTNVFDGVHSILLRWLLSSLVGLALGAVFAGARRARPHPAAVHAAHRAGARHRRALDRVRRARSRASGATTRRRSSSRRGCTRRRRSPGRTSRTTAGSRSRPRRSSSSRSQLFLRKTRYGLIIRAGVENRAMVQALGIDVRKAFTLVFAIGGIAAAIAGVLSGVYFNVVAPDQGTSLLIFAFIVVVIGGLGSIGGSAVAAVARRAHAAVRELLRLGRRRRHGRRPAARARAARAAARARGSRRGGARMSRRTLVHDVLVPLAVFGVLAVVPELHVSIPKLFDQPISSPGTLQLLGACVLFGGLALTYDLQFGYTGLLSFGHALYIAIGVYLVQHRDHGLALELLGRDPLHDGRRGRARERPRGREHAGRAGSRSRW